MTRQRFERIVLAYSGGLSSTAAIPWLLERDAAEVVTITVDLDQRRGLEAIRERALAAGAIRAHVVDASDEFARDFIVPALRAGALSTSAEVTLASLAQAAIAKSLVHLARLEGASVVAHGADEEPAVFERLVHDLDPALRVLAPAAAWAFSSSELADYVRSHRVSFGASEPPGIGRVRTSQPDHPACVEVAFDEGVPIALNGVSLPLVELMASLDTIAGAHGVEPGAVTLLPEAHRALQSTLLGPDADRSAGERGLEYVELVTDGHWFADARREADADVASLQKRVTGMTRLKLSKGRSEVIECRSGSIQSVTNPLSTTEIVGARS